MEKISLRYQISLYGDFQAIEANNELRKKFYSFDMFGKLQQIPFAEHEITETGIRDVQRIKMTTEDNSFTIEFNHDKIIFTILNVDINNYNMPSIGVFAKTVIDIICSVDFLFSYTYRRIGYVRYLLFDNPTSDEAFVMLNNPIPFQQNLPKGDWTNYIPTQYTSSNGDTYNVVTTIKHAEGSLKINGSINRFNGILASIDVNTSDSNFDNKYYNEGTLQCINYLRDIESQVTSDMCNYFLKKGNVK